MAWNYQDADCSLKNKFIAALSFPALNDCCDNETLRRESLNAENTKVAKKTRVLSTDCRRYIVEFHGFSPAQLIDTQLTCFLVLLRFLQRFAARKKRNKTPRLTIWIIIYSTLTVKKVAHTRLPCMRRVPELIPVLGSQPAGDVSHKPGGRLPLLSARPAVTPATLKRAATNFAAWWTEARWVGELQFSQDCYPTASRLRFEPRSFCAWVQHANHSDTEPPLR